MITPELIFNIGNTAVLPVWLLMLFAPRWNVTKWVANSHAVVLLLAIMYASIAFTQMGAIAEADFMTLKGIKNLFLSAGKSDYFVTAAWFHYLAFDLVVGTYIFQEAERLKLPHWAIVPCLLFTFLLGPFGFLLFYVVKTIRLALQKNN